MNTISIETKSRAGLGKKAAKLSRRTGQVPGVLYGGDEVLHFEAHENTFKDLVYTPDFYTVKLNVDGKEHDAILKDIQFHPVTDRIVHIDFLKLVPGKKVTVDVPVRFNGTPEGVFMGGKLVSKLRKITIKGTPENLVDVIDIDVEHLNLGDSVKVKTIELENLEVMNNPGIPIVSVEIPRAAKSALAEEEEAAAAAAAAEGEEGAAEGEGAPAEASAEQ